jgi:Na+-translocating ferredoxin:NAD+ oxidoreductase subunit A
MTDLFFLLLGAAFVNNFVLVKFLGLCPFMGVSNRLDAAYGMAMVTGLVLSLSAALAWMVHHWLLVPLGLGYLRTLGFVLVIGAVVQFTELAMHRRNPDLYRVLGIYLPLIASNCAVLGVALLNVQARRTLFEAVVYGVGASVGFGLVLILFSAMRERLETADVPAAWRGAPIALTTAGLMSLAFMGLAGLSHAT